MKQIRNDIRGRKESVACHMDNREVHIRTDGFIFSKGSRGKVRANFLRALRIG